MTEAITIQELMKDLTSVSSLDSRSVIVTDSTGNLEKIADLSLMHQRLFVAKAIEDLDECLTPGLHYTRTATTGTFPEGGKPMWMYCLVEVVTAGNDIIQRITRYNAKGMAIRYYDPFKKTFLPWVVISL